MMNTLAALCFAGFVASALILAGASRGPLPAVQRKRWVSLFLLYALAATFGAGLTQREAWPFSTWPLIAGTLPPDVTLPRLVGVTAEDQEYDVDYRAWQPFSFDELMSWLDVQFLTTERRAQDRAAAYLIDLANRKRALARAGNRFTEFDRFLGPVSPPLFILHPAIWSAPEKVPPTPFVRLRLYRETWNLEGRARGISQVRRQLMYQSPEFR